MRIKAGTDINTLKPGIWKPGMCKRFKQPKPEFIPFFAKPRITKINTIKQLREAEKQLKIYCNEQERCTQCKYFSRDRSCMSMYLEEKSS